MTDDDASASAHATDGSDRAQFYALYVTRFAGGFGFVTLATLLGKFVNLFDPSPLLVGLFTAGLTIAQTAAVVPMAYGGDAYDKRAVLLGCLSLGVVAYGLFGVVDSAWGFVGVRALQGIAITGAGIMSLSLIGQLSPPDQRAHHIGRANAARLGAGIGGSLTAGALWQFFGRGVLFGVLAVLLAVALVLSWRFLPADDTTGTAGFTDLAMNDRIVALSSFRAQYAVAVTLVRAWVPIFAGVTAARGGLAMGGIALGAVVAAEKFVNMLGQPRTGALSDRFGRSLFVAVGGTAYGLVALAVPAAPAVGEALGTSFAVPLLGTFPPAFLPLVALNGLLGLADSAREPASMALFADTGADEGGIASSFGVRELVWRPGSIAAPIAGGYLMAEVSMASVFYVGGIAAFTGVAAFVALLTRSHGRAALTSW